MAKFSKLILLGSAAGAGLITNLLAAGEKPANYPLPMSDPISAPQPTNLDPAMSIPTYRLTSASAGPTVPPSDDDTSDVDTAASDDDVKSDDDVTGDAVAIGDDDSSDAAPATLPQTSNALRNAVVSNSIPDGTYDCRTWSGSSYIGLGRVRSVNNSLDTQLLAKVGAAFTGAQQTPTGITVLYTSGRGYRESMDCTRQ